MDSLRALSGTRTSSTWLPTAPIALATNENALA
jgi:hypothetical protein